MVARPCHLRLSADTWMWCVCSVRPVPTRTMRDRMRASCDGDWVYPFLILPTYSTPASRPGPRKGRSFCHL
eukprot:9894214-Heterocapsa_arctica.AAC.1